MEITVISEEENPMLHRTDVRFRVSHAEATPDRLAIRDSLAARLNKDADEVVVRRLDTKFGMRETVGEAKVYQGAEFAEDVEQDYMLARNKIGDRAEEAAEPEVEADETDAEPAEEEAEPTEEEATEEGEPEEAEADEEPDEEEAAEEEAEEEPEEAEAEDEPEDGDDDGSAEADAGEAEDDEETEE